MCVCVCVCLGGEESEIIWNKCEKGKGKKVERRLSASVMNSICARVSVATVFAYARVTHHDTYLQFVWYMTMYSMLFVTKEFYT